MERAGSSAWKDLRMMRKYLLARMTADPAKRVRRIYEMYPPGYLFADHSTYINYGYWDNGCTTLDDASEALAALLAESAGFEPDNAILDVGFGYGDQDFAWLRDRNPGKIAGLNITPGQVQAARRRAAKEGLADRLDFRVGSATDMPFAADSFDRVVALECAHHFYPRSAFLSEAYRVLRPGGVLAATDIVPLDGGTARSEMKSRPLTWVEISVDEENWYSRDVYADKLTAAGFTEIHVQSIRDKVFEPWRQHIVAKLGDPAFQRRIGRMYHRMLVRMWADQALLQRELALLDYVVVAARKPAATAQQATGRLVPTPRSAGDRSGTPEIPTRQEGM